MKTSFPFPPTTAACLVALLAGPRLIKASGSEPGLQYDPDTALPCYMWEDNTGDLECEEVREYWDITPEQFSRWNPSVGLDCKPWGLQSYCVVPEVRLEEDPRPMPTEFLEASTTADEETASATATDTTTATDDSVGPDPTSWESSGCYVDEDEDSPVLEEYIDSGPFQSIASCTETCLEASFEFAGVKAGVQCFCGSSVTGERADDEDECDMPCAGYPLENCGGMDRISIFRQALFSDDGDDNANEDANEDADEDADTNENEDVQDEEGNEEEQTDDNAGDNAGSDDTDGDDTVADDDVVEDEEEVEEAEETTPSGSGAVVETETPESGASRNRIWFF